VRRRTGRASVGSSPRIAGFLDPAEYPRDRRITVAGRVTGTQIRSVGDYPYSYPVVAVTQYRIWPRRSGAYWHR